MLTHQMTHVLVTFRISASLFGCFQNGMGRDELKISTSPFDIFLKTIQKKNDCGKDNYTVKSKPLERT